MAVVAKIDSRGCFLSHSKFLSDLYGDTNKFITDDLFNIKTPFMMDEQAKATALNMQSGSHQLEASKRPKKSKRKRPLLTDKEEQLKAVLQDLIKKLEPWHEPTMDEMLDNNRLVRNKVKAVMLEAVENYCAGNSFGSNLTDRVVRIDIKNRSYLLPPRCEFHSLDIKEMNQLLDAKKANFKAILLDPPWMNKHVKRRKKSADGYAMLDTDDLFEQLPQLGQLLCHDGLLLIWCTNSQTHLEAIEKWLNGWNLVIKGKWHWLKITKSGQPVTSWSHAHKKPYEIIILAGRQHEIQVENDYVLISVPSGIHSHKPPLWPLLREKNILQTDDQCLEIFGRYLMPDTMTIGNQCLLFQDEAVFYK